MPRVELAGLAGQFGGMAALEDEPPVSWLVPKWLAARELSCIYGQGGTFKSYIALGWTLQLARAGLTTCYIAAEGTSGLRSRVDAWMALHNQREPLPGWHYYNANIHVDDPTAAKVWGQALVDYLPRGSSRRKQHPDLVVVDTLARNFSGDENSAKEVGQFIDGCEFMRRELHCAVLVVHHMGISTGRERGTAALRNATFAMFKTSDPRYSDRGGGSVLLECDRMKDAPMPKDTRVYFDTVALDADEHGTVYAVSQAMRKFPPRGKQRAQRKVVDAT